MIEIAKPKGLALVQKVLLVLVSLCLVTILLFLRGGIYSDASLNQLVSNSVEAKEAFSNGKPTVLEFYADWCEACKEMAKSMVNIQEKYHDKVNFVMMNVDNQRWSNFISKYEVNGIPQLNFFDSNSKPLSTLIGVQTEEWLTDYFRQLVIEKKLENSSIKLGKTSKISRSLNSSNYKINEKTISPRSHT